MRYFTGSINWVRSLFPFSHEGRQTLIYLLYAWSVPLLTIITKWILQITAENGQWVIFASVANKVANALLIGVVGYACFVSIRALKIGPNGLDVQSRDSKDDMTQVTTTTQTTVSPASTPE